MQQLRIDRDTNRDDSLFKRSAVILLDEKQWLYLQKRYHMTPRELQVARFVCHGFSNEEIGKDLKIRRGTVKTHLRNIYRRVRVKSKIALLLRFIEDVSSFYAQTKNVPPQINIVDKSNKAHIAPITQQKG